MMPSLYLLWDMKISPLTKTTGNGLNIVSFDLSNQSKSMMFIQKVFNQRIHYNDDVWMLHLKGELNEKIKTWLNQLKVDLDDDFLLIEEENENYQIWDAYKIGLSQDENVLLSKIGHMNKTGNRILWNQTPKWERRKNLQVLN